MGKITKIKGAMGTSYKVQLINQTMKNELMEKLHDRGLFELKAAIHGTCIKFFTDNKDYKEMWEDNFEPMQDWIRPHGRIFAVSGFGSRDLTSHSSRALVEFKVLYEPQSKTVIVYGCEYYGWIKSIALALVADFLEDFTSEHRRYSVHGSFIDFGGHGLAIIGPSGSGKTTLTYGLLRGKRANFLTDDWFFVRFGNDDVLVYSSEKNSYIRADLAKTWPEYAK